MEAMRSNAPLCQESEFSPPREMSPGWQEGCQVFGSGNPYKNREGILFEAQISHYINEFDEISRLGKGGYETVYKVRNKLDGQFYAIKKIIIKKATKGDCVKVLREVKVLAGLQHPNIVGYQTAWMEHVQLTCQKGEYSISM